MRCIRVPNLDDGDAGFSESRGVPVGAAAVTTVDTSRLVVIGVLLVAGLGIAYRRRERGRART
ncbi:hypothetical protein [Haloferax chudinovii]|uniref:PGF-CTERM sorting domain-containing protein n=1 Tax=Haloferax chudinovii TaxID=1109010 RepID=A0ABD5XBN9_9EURY